MGRNINSKATDNKEDDNNKLQNLPPHPKKEGGKRIDEKESVNGCRSYNSDKVRLHCRKQDLKACSKIITLLHAVKKVRLSLRTPRRDKRQQRYNSVHS